MNKRRVLRYLVILQVVVLFGLSSYAWFADKSNPSISQNNIRVTAAEGLNIKLDLDTASRTTVNLNELFADYSAFEIKQVSSVDAHTFYTIDFGAGLAYNDPRFVQVPVDENGLVDMVMYGFIDHDFYLQTEDYGKHVYFHKDTSITGVGGDAMRVALTYTINGVEQTIIFADIAENGLTATPYTTKAVIAAGEFNYYNIPPTMVGNQFVYSYDSKNGGRGTSDDDPIDLSKLLFTIPANSVMKVNMKIWLEGGDVDCDNTLSETVVNVNIKFGSTNILLDAPVLSANNQFRRITGLTTAMEYSYSNGNNAVYTPVTNANMQFPARSTVYVRIMEVPGVSPMSHTTMVVFN